MWTIGIWFFVILFAINGMFVYIADVFPAYSLVSPLNNSTITPATQPEPVTSTLAEINATSATATNATAGGGAAVGIFETAEYAWNSTIFVINLITGGFIWQALAVFGLPTLVFNTIQGLIGFFLILTVLHFWRGIF